MGPTNVELVFELSNWFDSITRNLKCSQNTRAYVTSVLTQYKSSIDDMSNQSIIVAYSEAKISGNFVDYQRIGDWVLWISSVYPSAISSDKEVVQTVGRLSYNACHRILRGNWPLYEELADNLIGISQDVNDKFLRLSIR